MKKFLIHSTFFFIAFFIVEKGLYYFLTIAPNREYDRRLEYVMESKMNKDLIVLGSSKGAADVLAGQIEKETGLSSYNLSYQGSNVVFHKFLLETLLKFNTTPKKVVLIIDTPFEFIKEESLKFRTDRLYPLSKYNYINQELINQNEKNALSWAFCLARVNRSNLNFKEVTKTITPMDSFGSAPYIKKSKIAEFNYLEETESYSTASEIVEKVEAFKAIQQLCLNNNIQLILAIPPNFWAFNSSFEKRIRALMKPENKLFIYDTLNPIYKSENYFNDYSHLFKNGAEIYTSELIDFIKNN